MSEPVPLLLDDPLVDLDDVRIENFLDLLLELTRDVQILLFTKDEATRRWFERSCAGDPSCRITRLQPIAAPVPVSVSSRLTQDSPPIEQARLQLNGDSGP